ncbi:hypothetical protein F441_18011 [Phytophthora nicotianae CJ01A1]|uniref:Uncharacterized protein n=2 Tax=Phytophthora nicotianae TaxID=4792 RepID=W2KCX3_PHYNI|nr:hypothetical protein L915_17658 [Phytophthora nicotianae]ETL29216.1 hypothetical protein L916_17551 [Phytophthora nicotianae]ETL82439.1 hypothetical protein L917_17392 [Phytophthora nicotianae]ETP05356.1 hypothetical protein F441_18011 [Phytophthora nicotianae CJ01A1]
MAPSEASGYFSWTQRVSFAGGFSRTIANFYIRICHRVRCGFSTSDQGVLIADYHYNPGELTRQTHCIRCAEIP